jgi:hypothetical protein
MSELKKKKYKNLKVTFSNLIRPSEGQSFFTSVVIFSFSCGSLFE